MLLKMFLGGCHELDSSELVAVTESEGRGVLVRDIRYPRFSNREMISPTSPRYEKYKPM